MRRLFVPFALAVAGLAVMPAGAAATHSPSAGPPFDFVRGAGTGSLSGDRAIVSAKSGPFGENPTGFFRIKCSLFNDFACGSADGKYDVECLRVQTHSAVVGGRSKTGDPAENVLVHISDNKMAGQPDTILIYGFSASPPDECPPPFPFESVEKGNFIVHDASPVPL
jgi:hypothetical protein